VGKLPTEYNQWIADEDMGNAREAIQSYEKCLKKKKRLEASKG
jgi:hypothetical protein